MNEMFFILGLTIVCLILIIKVTVQKQKIDLLESYYDADESFYPDVNSNSTYSEDEIKNLTDIVIQMNEAILKEVKEQKEFLRSQSIEPKNPCDVNSVEIVKEAVKKVSTKRKTKEVTE